MSLPPPPAGGATAPGGGDAAATRQVKSRTIDAALNRNARYQMLLNNSNAAPLPSHPKRSNFSNGSSAEGEAAAGGERETVAPAPQTPTSLFQLCVQVIKRNPRSLERPLPIGLYNGTWKPMLTHCDWQQLLRIEHHNPEFIALDEDLWKKLYAKKYPHKCGQTARKRTTWREEFIAVEEEKMNLFRRGMFVDSKSNTEEGKHRTMYLDSNPIPAATASSSGDGKGSKGKASTGGNLSLLDQVRKNLGMLSSSKTSTLSSSFRSSNSRIISSGNNTGSNSNSSKNLEVSTAGKKTNKLPSQNVSVTKKRAIDIGSNHGDNGKATKQVKVDVSKLNGAKDLAKLKPSSSSSSPFSSKPLAPPSSTSKSSAGKASSSTTPKSSGNLSKFFQT